MSIGWSERQLYDINGVLVMDWYLLYRVYTDINIQSSGKINLLNSGSGSSSLRCNPAQTVVVHYEMPNGDGAAGQVLSTNGAAILSWLTPDFANTSLSNLVATALVNSTTFEFTSNAIGTKVIKTSDQTSNASRNLKVTTGNTTGTNNTGSNTLSSGDSSQNSGAVSVKSGTASGSSHLTGNATLGSGDGIGTDCSSGDTIISTGAKTGVGTRGKIKLNDGSEGTTGHVWTSTDTLGNGNWAAPASGSNYTPNKESLTLNGTDITNQYKDLAQVIIASSLDLVVSGLVQTEGTDYTVSLTGGAGGKTRITFAGDLATAGAAALISGDILNFKYVY